MGLDLYYDPVVDEHVAHGPMGVVVPAWCFAPQRPDVATAGWRTAAMLFGVDGDGPIRGLDNPASATILLQIAGEFADTSTKARIWAAADEFIQPTWDRSAGEFTLGFGLNEAHPRGQLNARAMAGWVCTPGVWSRIFNAPNLDKFEEPTVFGHDFPRVALSEARWDGAALHTVARPQNADVEGSTTTMKIANLGNTAGWTMTRASGEGFGRCEYAHVSCAVHPMHWSGGSDRRWALDDPSSALISTRQQARLFVPFPDFATPLPRVRQTPASV